MPSSGGQGIMEEMSQSSGLFLYLRDVLPPAELPVFSPTASDFEKLLLKMSSRRCHSFLPVLKWSRSRSTLPSP